MQTTSSFSLVCPLQKEKLTAQAIVLIMRTVDASLEKVTASLTTVYHIPFWLQVVVTTSFSVPFRVTAINEPRSAKPPTT